LFNHPGCFLRHKQAAVGQASLPQLKTVGKALTDVQPNLCEAMILIVRNESGLKLLRPSRMIWKINEGTRWENVLEKDVSRRPYPQEVLITPGAHAVERIDNPFVPGGEPWLVLKGSRIGAAEAYLKRLCAATEGASNAVELVTEAKSCKHSNIPA
jgi:hypothetical protein